MPTREARKAGENCLFCTPRLAVAEEPSTEQIGGNVRSVVQPIGHAL
jgi:hypothetical protein